MHTVVTGAIENKKRTKKHKKTKYKRDGLNLQINGHGSFFSPKSDDILY